VSFAEWLPWLLFGLLSGALLDRWDRRRVMWTVDAARFAIVAGLAVAVLADQARIALLAVVEFLLGTGQTLVDTGARTTAAMVAVVNLLAAAGGAVMVLFAQEKLGLDAVGFGLLLGGRPSAGCSAAWSRPGSSGSWARPGSPPGRWWAPPRASWCSA
jgi:hypothetical protein